MQATEDPALLRITAAQFSVMAEAGALTGDRCVELLGGLLYEMSPQYVPHARAKDALCFALSSVRRALGSSLHVSSEGSVLLGDSDVPRPDIVLWKVLRVRGAIPGERVRLAVEVSHTAVADDLGPKRALYAAAAIPEYWVVDLPARVVRQFWAPADGAYGRSAAVPFGETLRSVTLPDIAVPTDALDGSEVPG